MKRTRISTVALILGLLSLANITLADGWAPASNKPPSAWDKLSTGTKNFFGKMGETVGLKKPAAKSTHSGWAAGNTATKTTQNTKTATAATKKSSSWNLFGKSEPKKPQSPSDFLAQPRNDPW
jgi:hypothetical protein